MCANLVNTIFLYENNFGKSWDAHLNTTKRFHSSAIIYIDFLTPPCAISPQNQRIFDCHGEILLYINQIHIYILLHLIFKFSKYFHTFHTLDVSKSDNIYNIVMLPQKLCLEMEILQKYQISCKNTWNTAKLATKVPRGSRKCSDFGVKSHTKASDHQI